jgi:translation initiation factor 5A
MDSEKEPVEVRELKINGYVLIDDEPCKIVSIDTSKPGKHGEAKARVEAFGIFDNKRRSFVHPVKHKVQVPRVNKGQAQIVSIREDRAQLMDLNSYEIFEHTIEEEFKGKLQSGKEVFYMESMGKKKITQVLG